MKKIFNWSVKRVGVILCCLIWGIMSYVSVNADNSGVSLKDIQGYGKNIVGNSDNTEEMIVSPYGVYYTTPQCEDMDCYWGEKHHDSIQFVICKISEGNQEYALVSVTAAINDKLDGSVQLEFNSENNRWEGEKNTLLEYDADLNKYIFSNNEIKVCLEKITEESAALYDRSHQKHGYQEPVLEGVFVSESGMNNGLTLYIYNLYNTKYYYVILATNDTTTTVMGEMWTLGEYIYTDECTINVDGKTYRLGGTDLDEKRIANTVLMNTLYNWGEDAEEYYLYRASDYFDGALNQNVYSGRYTIDEINAVIDLQYDENSESFQYTISINGKRLDMKSANAVCTGILGYKLLATDFIIDYSGYIINGTDILIKIPSISSDTYSCTFEQLENPLQGNDLESIVDSSSESSQENELTENDTETYESLDYSIYQEILDDILYEYDEYHQYALYDMDNDGVKELIVEEGSSSANWRNSVYSINQDGVVYKVGTFGQDVILYEAPDKNGIYVVWGKQGMESVRRIIKNGFELEEETILEDSVGTDGEYASYPNEITTATVDDSSLLVFG